MLIMKFPKDTTGAGVVRKVEEYLFLEEGERGRDFWKRAREETQTHLHSEKQFGYVGNDMNRVISLALEFNIKVEFDE